MLNGVSKEKLPQLFTKNINKLFGNKVHIKSWWQKFKTTKSDASTTSSSSHTTLDWRSLSPDRPPLPFFLASENSSSNTSLHRTAETGIIGKLIQKYHVQPFSTLRDEATHNSTTLDNTAVEMHTNSDDKKKTNKSFNRTQSDDRNHQPLCPILEESETVMSESTGSNMVHSNSSETHQSKISRHISEHEAEDRMAESASSINVIDPTTALERHPDTSPHLQKEAESSTEISPPNTPSINSSTQHQQAWCEIKSVQRISSDKYMPEGTVGNEDLCRRKFAKMVLAANKFQLTQPQHDKPTEMALLFDANGNIDMMRMTRHGKTELHKFVGNSQYVPPELFNNAKYQSDLGDIWVLGIFLYRMLVGKYPFAASNDQQLFKKMLHCDFSIPNNLSDDAKDIIRRMLAPDSARASLDLIIYHPWIEPYRHLLLDHYTHPTVTANNYNNTHRTNFISINNNNNNNADNFNESIQEKQERPKQKRNKSTRKSIFSTSTSTTVQEQVKKVHHSSRTEGLLHKALKLIFQGPFPPPKSPYHDLAHLGTRGSAFARYK